MTLDSRGAGSFTFFGRSRAGTFPMFFRAVTAAPIFSDVQDPLRMVRPSITFSHQANLAACLLLAGRNTNRKVRGPA